MKSNPDDRSPGLDNMPSVFIGYARDDNEATRPRDGWLDRLLVHLQPFERRNEFTIFYDKRTETGQRWHERIQSEVERCDIAVLLISGPFLNSNYISQEEMPVLLRREYEGHVRLVPVLLSPSNWDHLPFSFRDSKGAQREVFLSALQGVGAADRPVSGLDRTEQEELFRKVAVTVAGFAKSIRGQPKPKPGIVRALDTAAREPAVGERHRRLPCLSTVLPEGSASSEFCAFMHGLLHHEIRRQGCKALPVESFAIGGFAFATAVTEGKFSGIPPVVNFTLWGYDGQASHDSDAAAIYVHHEARIEGDPRVKNWVFLGLSVPDRMSWEKTSKILDSKGIHPHLFTQPDFEPWLFRCPPLLARYFPMEAARLDGNHGFQPIEFRQVERSFLDKDLPRHRELSLLGMPPRFAQHQNRPTPLGEVFVPQKFQAYGTTEAPRPLEDLLKRERPIVLIGDPGSGKTTVLHFLALLYAGEASLAGSSTPVRVPLYLALRDFAKSRSVRPTLVEALVHEAALRGVNGVHRWFFEALLLMGGAAVLLDGLDEAGDHASRAGIADLIEAFHREYPACPIWVTSREVGYVDTAQIDRESFVHFRVAPFGRPEQGLFIERWYDIQMAADPKARDAKKKRFLQAVDKVPAVRRLAGNPLLLTLMALVHHYQNELPRNRGELYQECVEMLLKHWQQSKASGDASDEPTSRLPLEKLSPPIYTEDAKKLLAVVALRVQESNEHQSDDVARGDIPEPVLRGLCEERRARLIAGRNPTPEEEDHARSRAKEDIEVFLSYIRERSGLLIWRGGDIYAFAHLSFLEYLAAYQRNGDRALGLEEHARFFREKSALPSWRETLIQLVYLLAKNTSEESFVDVLLSSKIAEGAPAGFWQTLGIAVSDELVPAAKQVRRILEELWRDWSATPDFTGDTYSVLQQIAEFGETSRQEALKDLLTAQYLKLSGSMAMAVLHLHVWFFGWPEGVPGAAESPSVRLRGILAGEGGARWMENAGQLLTDAGPEKVAQSIEGAALVDFVRGGLLARMRASERPAKERARSGRVLAFLGDPRLGVVPHRIEDLLETEFCFVPGDGDSVAPGHEMAVDAGSKPFWIARFPVSVAQFRLFATRENYRNPEWWDVALKAGFWKDGHFKVTDGNGSDERWVDGLAALHSRLDLPNHPVASVTWFEAVAYAAWFDKQLRKMVDAPNFFQFRLPTAAEWQLAAQGGRWIPKEANQAVQRVAELTDSTKIRILPLEENPIRRRRYPWGVEEPEDRANWRPTGINYTSAVGCFEAGIGPMGVEEMAGNVWEWTSSWDDSEKTNRLVLGGAWASDNPDSLRTTVRHHRSPGSRRDFIGFRLVCGGESC